jgi:hypothetical protein
MRGGDFAKDRNIARQDRQLRCAASISGIPRVL